MNNDVISAKGHWTARENKNFAGPSTTAQRSIEKKNLPFFRFIQLTQMFVLQVDCCCFTSQVVHSKV